MTGLANRPQRAFFSIMTRVALWHLKNPWAVITCCRTKACLMEIILSLHFFSRVCCCSDWAHKTTHHRSRRCLHSVRGHSHSNLLHCRARKKTHLLQILPLTRQLEGYRKILDKYPCDGDNWGPACLLIRNYMQFYLVFFFFITWLLIHTVNVDVGIFHLKL